MTRAWNLPQFSWVAQLCVTLCDPAEFMPGLPVHHHLPELTQTHVHWVGDAIQPSHPLSSTSPPAFNLCQHNSNTVIIKKFEILQELPKCDTENTKWINAVGKLPLKEAQHRVATDFQFVKKKKKYLNCNKVKHSVKWGCIYIMSVYTSSTIT